LDENRLARFNEIACEVGEELQKKGWRGLFGIDCIYDIERDNLHLIEVNARQPASTTYESQLQENIRELAPDHFKNCATIFEAHIAALRDTKTSDKSAGLIEINDGAQIILRIPTIAELRKTNEEIAEISAELRVQKYIVIEYLNTKSGSDLLRIQSDRGIMESQNKFNARGKEILEIVTGVEEKHDIM
jgi:D-alanine-D-alanine ligase-like ATP-grasp enzyme